MVSLGIQTARFYSRFMMEKNVVGEAQYILKFFC